MPKQKDIEMQQLSLFRNLISDFPTGNLIDDGEEPDFLIKGTTTTIGIELTELHHAPSPGIHPLQAVESMRRRVVQQAEKIYEAKDGPPIRCTVHMHGPLIKKDEIGLIASAIADLAIQNIPSSNSSIELDDFSVQATLDSRVSAVSIHRMDCITEPFFSAPGSTWLPSISAQDIARALSPKEMRYSTYRAKCDAVWLVIVTDYSTMATWFDFPQDAAPLAISTAFDRVYLLGGFGRKVLPLPILP